MNRNLLAFAVLLIVLGAASGYIQVALIGLFLLLPAVLTTPRPRPQRIPTTQAPQSRRISPKPAPFMEVPATSATSAPDPAQALVQAASTPQRPQQFPFSAPLFPNTIFPSLSTPLSSPSQPKKETKEPAAAAQRDELLEIGAFLAVLRLVLG